MTTRPAPTKASHYVAAILSALRTFLDGEAAARLGPEARSDIAEASAGFSSWIMLDLCDP